MRKSALANDSSEKQKLCTIHIANPTSEPAPALAALRQRNQLNCLIPVAVRGHKKWNSEKDPNQHKATSGDQNTRKN
jgi:hypothetical protein